MVLEVAEGLELQEKVILPCATCKCPTLHVLSKGKFSYYCGCGDFIQIEYKSEEE